MLVLQVLLDLTIVYQLAHDWCHRTLGEEFHVYKQPCNYFGLFLNTIGLKNDLELRIVNALIFFHRPDGVARKAGDVSVADWR